MANIFICDETQELLKIYDYKPSKDPMKYKARRNGLAVTLHITTLGKEISKGDFEDWKLCAGVNNQPDIEACLVLIEQVGHEFVYRSRNCQKVVNKDVLCDNCSSLFGVQNLPNLEDGEIEKDNKIIRVKQETDMLDMVKLEQENKMTFQNKELQMSIEMPQRKSYYKSKKLKMKYRCSFCDINFTSETSFHDHYKENHENGSKTFCPYDECTFDHGSRKEVIIHYNFEHRKSQVFNCNDCEHVFYTNSNLRTHIENVHEQKSSVKDLLPKS